ncbi:hypothetical protein BPAE_0195g00150 [Botrytis paeoniae]|uniref:Uncharacterized protein n=1 Tax=Botrytis paeoniae TaxID=278948 RepID=A0A4Z1FEZ1_9HELO|nr:hypothetical protein BPAE_0195g00150 [Botrytis paeoniae]
MPPRFPPRVPREHINNLPPMTQDDLDAARKEFPEEKLASRSLEKYAKKHWIKDRYFWKDGFRYVCGSDTKGRLAMIPEREYTILLKNTPTLAMIDQTKKKGLQRLVAHQSESEWALPQDHGRHLFNFPQEIINMISRCILTIEDCTITPDVTTSDWAQVFKSHKTHSLDSEQSLESELSFNTVITHPCKDQEGTYFELRKVYRPRIDAAILRVCKNFRDNATNLLYKENVFHFTAMDWSETESPISWIDCENTRSWKIPEFEVTQRRLLELSLLLTLVHETGPFESFEPDSFAVNDAIRLIESLGTPVLKDCWLYTGLERLVIEVQKDPYLDLSLLLDLGFLDSGGSVHQQYITSLLEGELRKLKTIKTLEVYEVLEVEVAVSAAEPSVDNPEPRKLMKREKLDIAEPTIVWFKNRASKLVDVKLFQTGVHPFMSAALSIQRLGLLEQISTSPDIGKTLSIQTTHSNLYIKQNELFDTGRWIYKTGRYPEFSDLAPSLNDTIGLLLNTTVPRNISHPYPTSILPVSLVGLSFLKYYHEL